VYKITQKTIDDVTIWNKTNKNTDWKTKSSYEKALNSVFYIIELKDDKYSRVTKSQHDLYNFLSTVIIKYITDKENSVLRHFKNIFNVECTLVGVVKFNSKENSGRKLNITKEHYLKQIMKNDIYYFYLQTIKYEYPLNAVLNECYFYSYFNSNGKKKIIVYPAKISTMKDMKNIIDIIYNETIDEKKGFENIGVDKYYYTIEMLILMDKYNSLLDDPNENYIIKDEIFDKKKVSFNVNKYGLHPYKKLSDLNVANKTAT
jgi:hypothetical protein